MQKQTMISKTQSQNILTLFTYICAYLCVCVQAHEVLFARNEKDNAADYWRNLGKQAIDKAMQTEQNKQLARNSILFIGDGMSLSTITAARILQGQLMNETGEEGLLSFETLPNVALLKTYNLDQQIPDSAATATALLSGVKANFYTLGVDGNVKLNETNCDLVEKYKVASILEQAIKAGKSTGIVTNTRITHATPAAAYAHSSNRRWEFDSQSSNCKDIARQLIEDEPGIKLNVVFGGGRRNFFSKSTRDFKTRQAGLRKDDRNLINDWIEYRQQQNASNFAFVNSTKTMLDIDIEKTDYVLGLFSYSHMSFEELRDQSDDGEPSLPEMTQTAIRLLQKNPRGFVLIVESGRIDHSHHENIAGVALRETITLSWAVQGALREIENNNYNDTLLIVTADHAHALTINGIASRGSSILGVGKFGENSTQMPYTTLLYGNGPGNSSPRRDPTIGPNSTDSPFHTQHAAIFQQEAFHDGSDVGVFATGPFAHLFQGVQEQSYVAHVMAFAMCIGEYENANSAHCDAKDSSSELRGRLSASGHQSSLRRTDSSAASASLAQSVLLATLVVQLAFLQHCLRLMR